jgi:hypothetical protein
VLCEIEGAGWLADGAANVWLDGLPPPTALPGPQLVTPPWVLMHVLLLPPLHARQLASTSAPTLIPLTSLMADYPGCDDKFAARCGRALRGEPPLAILVQTSCAPKYPSPFVHVVTEPWSALQAFELPPTDSSAVMSAAMSTATAPMTAAMIVARLALSPSPLYRPHTANLMALYL